MLRILAMIQIITLHAFNFGGITAYSHEIGGSFLKIADLVWAFNHTPVNLFLLLTGYFSVESEFNIRKKLNQTKHVYFLMAGYSIVLSIAFWAVSPPTFFGGNLADNMREILRAFTPFLSRTWYYLTLFIIVSLLSPFVNTVLQRLTKRQYLFLLSICFFVVSIWPVLAKLRFISTFVSVDNIVSVAKGKGLYSFLLMYMIGGYIKRFMKGANNKKAVYLLGFFALCMADWCLNLTNIGYQKVFGWYSNPFVIGQAVCLFMLFREFDFYSKGVNTVAKATLGVYIIHEFRYVRKLIWSVFDFKKFPTDDILMFYLRLVGIVLLIFVACTAAELLREGALMIIKKRIAKNSDAPKEQQ